MAKCHDIHSGKLRNRIRLERRETAPLPGGGQETQWVKYAAPWAMIHGLSARERFEADRLESTVRFRCVIRFRDDVKASDRVRYRGKVYNIRGVYDVEERRHYLELDLTEGVAA